MTVVSLPPFPGPDEVEGFWAWDKMHAPRPITPLSQDLIVPTLSRGFTNAQAEFDAPIAVSDWFVNYYMFVAFHPLVDQVELADRITRYKETLERMVPSVGRQWDEEWKPPLIVKAREGRKADHSSLTDEQLLARLTEYTDHMQAQWHVHGRINFVLIASANFCDYYDEVVKPSDPTEAYQCLQGFHTESVGASRGLWRLSRLVRQSPALSALFASTPPNGLIAALEGSDEGRAFLGELHAFLDEYGWRSDAVYDMADVTWREEPAIPLAAMSSYLGLGDEADPEVLFNKAVAKREDLMAKARALLAKDAAGLAKFNELYEAAKYNLPVTEDHAFWIDQTGVAVFRRFVMEIGRRLADRGVISEAADVHMLFEREVRDALTHGGDFKAVVAQRRAEMEAAAAIVPPPALGNPPPPAPDPFMDAITVRLLGLVPPDENPPEAGVLKGVPGSPGVVTGTARVVRSLSEASKLEDGDIMVCEMTLPPWVPLFSIVSGVVTDTGGVLSHCAIVARECGLPAVVGTQVGTITIPDGATITIDGTKGVVLIG